jgi:DNA processing protein
VSTDDLVAWIQLSRVPGVGVVLFLRLLEALGSPDRVLRASARELQSVRGIRAELAGRIRAANNDSSRREAESEFGLAQQEGIRIVTIQHDEYPDLLRNIYGPPPFLSVRGDLAATESVSVAMVGTRRATSHGLRAAESIAAELAAQGITIVSGMAQGIDSACHEGALAADGRTAAVLGCGFGHRLPSKAKKLLQRIAERGVVLSEFGMGMPPHPENFPRRNRIISGLCIATVVVEAGERSGALITASFEVEQGREVFAVPGRMTDDRSAGCNRLIQEGAHLLQHAADIRNVIGGKLPTHAATGPRTSQKASSGGQQELPRKTWNLTDEEKVVYDLLAEEARHVDELTRESGHPAHRVAQILLALELKGAILREPGMRYARSS